MTEVSHEGRVFGIGLNKTGTSTLMRSGEILGYRKQSCRIDLLEDIVLRNDLSRVEQVVKQYDIFGDWPWPLIYKDLDRMFPGSKFILTTRKDENVWFESLRKHALTSRSPFGHCRKLAYGYRYPQRHRKEHIELYRRHNNEVRSYFAGRENDFLEICWEKGDDFEKLCNFLGKDVPETQLPHAMKGAVQLRKVNRGRLFLNTVMSRLGI